MTATSIGPPTVSSDEVMCRWSFVMEIRLSAIVAMSWTLKYARIIGDRFVDPKE